MPTLPRLNEPLSETSIRDRRALLAISLVASFVGWTGIMPDEIPFLGMKFAGDKTSVAVFMLVVLAFFWFSFVFRGYRDYKQLVVEATQFAREHLRTDPRYAQFDKELLEKVGKAFDTGSEAMQRKLMGRSPESGSFLGLALADYWMPLGFGFVAFGSLLYRTVCLGFGS